MRTALLLTAFALSSLVAVKVAHGLPSARPEAAMTVMVDDPDPADCPFCGGDPALHVKRIFQIEQITLGLSVSLMR
jgi:hypothetical protein